MNVVESGRMIHSRFQKVKTLRRLILGFFLLLPITPQSALANQKDRAHTDRLEQSIGKIVRIANRDRSYQENSAHAYFGDGRTWAAFFDEYEKNIKNLPVDNRVEYLWFGMWFLKFGANPGEEFTETVAKDCPEEFTLKLKKFITKHREVEGDPKVIHFAEKILGPIQDIAKPR
ncbi:MAG: hypothetical protein KDI90_01455 [Alphaproteobacteria bacterium]|nr:hypothetical protein [Alphaproteobacteria bacterium]MCB9974074.1 hypothetical protein [Rhodospirillales bacterium]